MLTDSEIKNARSAYNWLRISPLLTIPTFAFLGWLSAQLPCAVSNSLCSYQYENLFGYGLGILGSGLWHLILLQYANNKESDFVRKHGRQALKYAAIRTAIPFSVSIFDYIFSADGALVCVSVIILIILWYFNTKTGLEEIKKEVESLTPVEEAMPEPNQTQGSPANILQEILEQLDSESAETRLEAIAKLNSLEYSSSAARLKLEQLSLHDPEEQIRAKAMEALSLSAQRIVSGRTNQLSRTERNIILQEINKWEKAGLLDKLNADVIRRRYDFDIAPQPAAPAPLPTPPKPAPIQQTVPQPEPSPAAPPQPAGPRPTLLQTLLSETSIKIFLYLGAFFVIASATILGALVEAARLPILFAGTAIFGVVSIALRKRLPQPSFALFIVFSFLLPITANVLQESFDFTPQASAVYWMFIFLLMSAVWIGSTWLYESRLFSIVAFLSFALALYRIGDIFKAEFDFYPAMTGLAALAGLVGTWMLKRWKDSKFALPLFISAQFLQALTLGASLVIYLVQLFNNEVNPPWYFAHVFTWGFAFLFFACSNGLYPFLLFPWLAAATFIPLPWFIGSAFELESLGGSILFTAWGLILSAMSEAAFRIRRTKKYSLPVLLASIPALFIAASAGFIDDIITGFLVTLVIAGIYAILHLIRSRGWLWALALLSFSIAYFTFFALPFMEKLDVFFGYQLLGIILLMLLPDLILKNDLKANLTWRLPLRIYGAIFTLWLFAVIAPASEYPLINTSIIFCILAAFFTIYALRYHPFIGYIATTALAIGILYGFNHFRSDYWLEALILLSAVYFFTGFIPRKNESLTKWRTMLESSGLALGSIMSVIALALTKEHSGWFVFIAGAMFIVEMYSREQGLFEIGAQVIFCFAASLVLTDLKLDKPTYIVTSFSIVLLSLDMVFFRTFKANRIAELPVKGIGAIFTLAASFLYYDMGSKTAAIGFGIFTVFFVIYAAVQRKASFGYAAAAYFPITILLALDAYHIDAWLPTITGIALLYYMVGFLIRAKEDWSAMLRNSALTIGSLMAFYILFAPKETSGWYVLAIGLLFAAEMYLRKDGRFELGMPILFSIGVFVILHDLHVTEWAYQLLAFSLVWLSTDMLAHLMFSHPRPLMWVVRGIGALISVANFPILFYSGTTTDASIAVIGFGVYSLLFLTISLLYRQPTLGYAFTVSLPLFVGFLFYNFGIDRWIHPVIGVAVAYYAAGYLLRRAQKGKGWDDVLLFSGLGLGVIVSIGAAVIGEVDAALPVAIAATLWALEAFAKKNVWLAFPANGLYLLSYFIILFALNVDEPQYYSIGAAALGLIQHYLLVRAGSKTGAFVMGMLSQFVLLGTTYFEMVGRANLGYYFLLFFQSLVVLGYGIVSRSRSLTFFPIGFVVLGTVTVIYNALRDISTVVLVGCAGVLLLTLGILAVVMRERITRIGERLSDWNA